MKHYISRIVRIKIEIYEKMKKYVTNLRDTKITSEEKGAEILAPNNEY